MATKSGSLNYWRDYFRTSSYDIFDIIEQAMVVAASDCPKEFRLRRDRIAELLFSSTLTRCSGCDQVQLAVPANYEDDGGCKSGLDRDGEELEAGASKESKSSDSREDQVDYNDKHGFSNYSYGEAEALTDEIEEESQIIGEVLRIKELLLNSEEESDSVLYESLRRLQLMALTVDILQATEIGKVVSRLRKHGSKELCNLARTLYIGWKGLAEEWLKATTAIAASEGTPDSVNPSVLDEEEGLPSPPMDEAFLATQTGSIDFSQIFDGMDDDGNPRNCGEIKSHENGRKSTRDNQNAIKRKQQRSESLHAAADDGKSNQVKKQENVAKLRKASDLPLKQDKMSNADSGPRTPPKLVKDQKQSTNFQNRQKRDKNEIQKTPACALQNKFEHSEEAVVQMKLEATKRKLQERYQQVENAKRQRTIQVMELHDLPKQGMGNNRNPHVKPGNHNRQWSQGRR